MLNMFYGARLLNMPKMCEVLKPLRPLIHLIWLMPMRVLGRNIGKTSKIRAQSANYSR